MPALRPIAAALAGRRRLAARPGRAGPAGHPDGTGCAQTRGRRLWPRAGLRDHRGGSGRRRRAGAARRRGRPRFTAMRRQAASRSRPRPPPGWRGHWPTCPGWIPARVGRLCLIGGADGAGVADGARYIAPLVLDAGATSLGGAPAALADEVVVVATPLGRARARRCGRRLSRPARPGADRRAQPGRPARRGADRVGRARRPRPPRVPHGRPASPRRPRAARRSGPSRRRACRPLRGSTMRLPKAALLLRRDVAVARHGQRREDRDQHEAPHERHPHVGVGGGSDPERARRVGPGREGVRLRELTQPVGHRAPRARRSTTRMSAGRAP